MVSLNFQQFLEYKVAFMFLPATSPRGTRPEYIEDGTCVGTLDTEGVLDLEITKPKRLRRVDILIETAREENGLEISHIRIFKAKHTGDLYAFLCEGEWLAHRIYTDDRELIVQELEEQRA